METGFDVISIYHCPIFIVSPHDDTRTVNGLLSQPPQVFVIVRSEEHDSISFKPVEWEVAQALAPRHMRDLAERMTAKRYARAEQSHRESGRARDHIPAAAGEGASPDAVNPMSAH